MLYKLLFLGHRNLIKKITQTAVINIVFKRIFIELNVSYASQHTVSKVTVTIFENCYIYIINNRGSSYKVSFSKIHRENYMIIKRGQHRYVSSLKL